VRGRPGTAFTGFHLLGGLVSPRVRRRHLPRRGPDRPERDQFPELPGVGGDVVGLVVGGRELGPMVLANVFASGDRHDTAKLVFRRADAR
jgi:hypothetical protein